jgi:subtilisin family serine protease
VGTAVAAALVAGSTAPAVAGTGVARTQAQQGAARSGVSWITLITGDKVAVDGTGKVVGIQRAKGREDVAVFTRKANGHTYVIPEDALRLIATGKVDRRLFDITTLSRAEYRKAEKANGLGLIVSYKGTAPAAKAELHAAYGTEVTRTFKKLNAEAVTAPVQDATDVWSALTNEPKSGAVAATAESGLKTVWLNAIQKAALDKSVPQIGAPTAWAAGWDGKGVKVAILDTGIDTSHPDLSGGKVAAAKNFSDAKTTADKFGHGTHVASIVAGTGAKSGGKYTGVAPKATLLNGKVLDDAGYGDDAGIIAGMEWAAASGAKIANLSLGSTDTPGIDPLEEAVNTLSASTGTLFVIAAGNEGSGPGTIGSPGSAEAALTVGAVDKSDVLADFSSRGPTVTDGSVKPDLTAPGVDITAAAAAGSVIDSDPTVPHPAPGYLTISGTSMATPHVSGAAAILAEEHPDWTGQQLKEALVGSTVTGGYTAFEQGSGRVDVAKAITQSVVAEKASLSFGTALWPHADDPKIPRIVTYRNLGKADVTLDLSFAGTGPNGEAAPAGFFTLDQTQVTVPAGGTAEATLTADTTLGGTVYGGYSGVIVATATDGSQTIRTAAGVNREAEAYNLTLKHIARNGSASSAYDTIVEGLDGTFEQEVFEADGTVVVRVPKGSYSLATLIDQVSGTKVTGTDLIVRPLVKVTADTTLTFDARTAKAVKVKVPDTAAKSVGGSVTWQVINGDGGIGIGLDVASFDTLRTANSGAALSASQFQAWLVAGTAHGTKEYDVSNSRTGSFYTGYSHTYPASDFAKITAKAGSTKANSYGAVLTGTGNGGAITIHKLPFTATVYVSAKTASWLQYFVQGSKDLSTTTAVYFAGDKTYVAGKSYSRTFNVGVFGPKLGSYYGVWRDGNDIYGYLPFLSDGQGHDGDAVIDSANVTVYRNGVKLVSGVDPVYNVPVTVPAGKANYKVTTTISRAKQATVSTKTVTTWTFSSAKTSSETNLPVSVVRFKPALSTSSTAKAKAKLSVPVTVEGAAAGKKLKSLRVYVSFDGGKKWTKLTVTKGKVTVTNPKAGGSVSLRALVTDRSGNTLSESIINAYRTK